MNPTRLHPLPLLLLLLIPAGGEARADLKSKASQELAESLMAKFGARAGKSAPALAQRIEGYAARYGNDALVAVRKTGPAAFGLIEAAGKDGGKAVSVLARHGEAGATRVLSRPQAMSQFLRYGDEAANVLVKHPGVAEGLVERGGMPAVKALAGVTPRNGRRIAMLLEGDLAEAGRHHELLEVIARYGDRAATFVWENKGALAVGTALAAFLAHPEPFLNGTKDVTVATVDKVAQPLAREAAASVNWNLIALVTLVGGGTVLAAWLGLFRRTPPDDRVRP